MRHSATFLLVSLVATGAITAHARVQLGCEVLEATQSTELQGKRIGLLTNPSGANSKGRTTLELLRNAKGVQLVALFAAEHGIGGDIPAGTEFKDSVDSKSSLPVYSLYGPGPTRKPTAKMLKDIDALVYDIQDTGCRSYTFIASMGLAMEACAEQGIEFIVLDRPNPLGGLRVEGPRLSAEFKRLGSLVSKWDVPYAYGMTCGELARMINGEGWIKKKCRLTVVPMRGWERRMTWTETGLPWIATSPNIPRADTPLYYTATGMLGEIGGVNIGNRMGLQFQCILAPWLSSEKLCDQLNGYKLPGVRFVPFTTNHNALTLNGARIDFTDRAKAPLLAITFYSLEAVKKVSGKDLFAEALKAGRNFDMFDRVNGTIATRKMLQHGSSAASIVKSWRSQEDAFRKLRTKYLLY